MNRLFIWTLLVLSCTSLTADTTGHNYAYGMALHNTQTSSFYKLNLPMDVYRSAVHEDLRDVRVINAAGEEVPVWLRSELRQNQQEDKNIALPVFPLAGNVADNSTTPRINVVTSKDGAIVNISDKNDKTNQTKTYYYIIDASRVDGRLRSLRLKWESIPAGKIVAMSVSSSNDLHNWTALSEASLSYLDFNDQKLYQDKIDLPHFTGRYLRLSPVASLENRLSSVTATVSHKHTTLMATRSLKLKTQLDIGASAFIADADARLPVNKLNIDLGQDNAVVDYILYARAHENATWTRLASHNFYHYTIQGKQTRNQSIDIKPGMWRYFKLEPAQKSGPKQLPVLELSWTPHQLIFMGQGKGPYRLVYGRGDSGVLNDKLSKLIKKIKPDEYEQAVIGVETGAHQTLCGEPCLKVSDSPVDYTRYVLWMVVVLGSLLVLWMVVRLSREMKG